LIDFDARRHILAWGVATFRLTYSEYNALMRGLTADEKDATGCAGKTAFDEAPLARKIASRTSSRHDYGMAVYKCERCGKFHIGRKKPTVKHSTTEESGYE
jgi:hypothetical protein